MLSFVLITKSLWISMEVGYSQNETYQVTQAII